MFPTECTRRVNKKERNVEEQEWESEKIGYMKEYMKRARIFALDYNVKVMVIKRGTIVSVCLLCNEDKIWKLFSVFMEPN